VKLSLGSRDGKTFILKLVDPGEVLGLSATFSGNPYELTAETTCPCQLTFVERADFLGFLQENPQACFRVAEQLSLKYKIACHELRSLGLSYSAGQKLARLLLDWSSRSGESVKAQPCVKLSLTHDEIAQLIGTSRETVRRVFADFRKQRIVQSKGSTFLIRNKESLTALAADR
jgi:CRP/FNR family transcriptional regulator, cyclic AMP receptor protein